MVGFEMMMESSFSAEIQSARALSRGPVRRVLWGRWWRVSWMAPVRNFPTRGVVCRGGGMKAAVAAIFPMDAGGGARSSGSRRWPMRPGGVGFWGRWRGCFSKWFSSVSGVAVSLSWPVGLKRPWVNFWMFEERAR